MNGVLYRCVISFVWIGCEQHHSTVIIVLVKDIRRCQHALTCADAHLAVHCDPHARTS